MVTAELMAGALASVGVAAVAHDRLLQFCTQVAGGGGLICINEMYGGAVMPSGQA
jgi:hypothetical protein